MNTKRLLIIDDDEGIVDALTLVLEDEGYQVRGLCKADQIEEEIATYKPHLIILDILISGMDGRAICRKIKANPQTSSIPVLMCSAHPSAQKGATAARADGFLAKPFSIDVLIQHVEKLSSLGETHT